MPPRSLRLVQAIILAGYGLFFIDTAGSGTLAWYLSGRFFVLVLAAGLAFLVLARFLLPLSPSSPAPWPRPVHPPDINRQPSVSPSPGPAHPPRHIRPLAPRPASPWRLLVLALPLALAVLVPAHPLGPDTIAARGFNRSPALAAPIGAARSPARVPPPARTLLDWARLIALPASPENFVGQPADVTGFVYHAPGLPPDEFVLARFALACCAADAFAVGLRVRWSAAAALPAGDWLRVQGQLQSGHNLGHPLPILVARTVLGLDRPQPPYLHP